MEESWESLARGKDTSGDSSWQSGWFLEGKLQSSSLLPLWMLTVLQNPQKDPFCTKAMAKTEIPN